jgi:hypothetical protein|tara:strand:+ start:578 stop:1243 length:666 start_codon:yes stop_codon:yes gene_type:complete
MIKSLTKTSMIDTMAETLLSDGVFKIENYLDGNTLQNLHDEVFDKCQNEAGHYEFGRNYRGEDISTFPKDSTIFQVYDAGWMRNLHQLYTGRTDNYGMNVFATHDYKFDGELARNGWLHFDKHWRLKFFIYLTDIDKSSGAFNCSVGSRLNGQKLRQQIWGTPERDQNRIDLDYPELLSEYPCEPVEAPAGTLIVFDTDTFHKGGKCDEGKERLIVRLHCA